MKKYVVIAFLLISGMLQAQNRPRVEEMHERKWRYMVQQSHLLPEDSAKVQPVFIEFERSVWKLMEQNKDFLKKFRKDRKDKSNPNYEGMNDRYVNLEIKKAQLLKDYYLKLKKILSDEVIFEYFNAERSFRNELIKDWKGRHKQDNHQ